VSSSSFSPDEIRAAAQTHRELGPEYEGAVIESFLDKVGKEIDARVDERLGRPRRGRAEPASAPKQFSGLALPVTSMILGIPLTAIVVSAGNRPPGIVGLLVVWLAIVAINVAYSLRFRPPPGR
jgi:hypothetical protein